MYMNSSSRIKKYVEAVYEVSEKKCFTFNAPYLLMRITSLIIEPITKVADINQSISIMPMKKLIKPNNIISLYSASNSYGYRYSFRLSLAAWFKDSQLKSVLNKLFGIRWFPA